MRPRRYAPTVWERWLLGIEADRQGEREAWDHAAAVRSVTQRVTQWIMG